MCQGLYLTDVTFCREGNPSHRDSTIAPGKKLLNFNKYHKLARIVQGLNSVFPRGLFCLNLFSRHATLSSAV